MSGHESYPPPGGSFPPPGGNPPPGPQPAYPAYPAYPVPPAQPGYAHPGPLPPGMLGAAHKPGAIPLRPLGLGDLYDGAFRIIRYNPKVTVGAPVLVSVLALLLPLAISAALTWGAGYAVDLEGEQDLSTGEVVALVTILGSFVIGAIAQSVAMLLVTGMIARVVDAAAVGRRLSIGEAWRATHGKRWRLVGLPLVLGIGWAVAIGLYVAVWFALVQLVDSTPVLVVFGIVSGLVVLCGSIWVFVRAQYLAVSTLVLEDVGIFGAVGRALRLTRGSFWRTFGILVLTYLIATIASYVFTCPLGILLGVLSVTVPPEYELVLNIGLQAVSSVLSAALITPFMTTVATLQYVDLRMRREAYDVELMERAGITAS